jgi:phosphomannomutase
MTDPANTLQNIQAAHQAGKISAEAVENLSHWLTDSSYAAYVPEIEAHVQAEKWAELNDAFWTVIPFGTGGRRGKMYPIGSNAINDRTIGESAQGLADYVRATFPEKELSCALAYDTRHNSRHFAELCAGVMVAAGFKVYFLDDYRSTPALSYLVRMKGCDCGIMVTASHNPPSDNAVKVYWSTGGQILPPHDKKIIEGVMSVTDIGTADFAESVKSGKVVICTEELDAAFTKDVVAQGFSGDRTLKILYSPLHGVGESAVAPVLAASGFANVKIYEAHREQNGDFPNVPGHVSNPENPAVFDGMIAEAKAEGYELCLATDPDCDRMGAAAPLTLDTSGAWATFNGNQLAVLLSEFVLSQKQGSLTPEHFQVTTLVSTRMLRKLSESCNVGIYDRLLVGFKWIAGQIDAAGSDKFLFGAEESHGYMAGDYVRDKDGALACMLMSQCAAAAKAEGKSLHEKLDSLYWQHGYHEERLINVPLAGQTGMQKMESLMAKLRSQPPQELAGLKVVSRDDLEAQTTTNLSNAETTPLADTPSGNVLYFHLSEEGNGFAVRPSGTEPKVKFYLFAFVPAEELADLDLTREEIGARLEAMEAGLREFVASVE